jgi:hypothetical protein
VDYRSWWLANDNFMSGWRGWLLVKGGYEWGEENDKAQVLFYFLFFLGNLNLFFSSDSLLSFSREFSLPFFLNFLYLTSLPPYFGLYVVFIFYF